MEPEIDWSLIDRFLAGDCTPAEVARVRAMVRATPNALERLALVRERLAVIPDGERGRFAAAAEPDAEASWARLQTQLTADAMPARQPWPRHRRWAWASMAVGAAAAGLVLATSRGRWVRTSREFVTAAGMHTTIRLADGSRLTLGPASRLEVPSDFATHDRTVDLEGEALFDVVHDGRRPFTVRTARSTVRDVGTRFVVRTYKSDDADRVAVEQGEVQITNANAASTNLRAGDGATITRTTLTTVGSTGVAALTAWVSGNLAFEDTPLRTVIADLEREYDVSIAVGDPSRLSRPITARFAHEPIEDVLKELSVIVDTPFTVRIATP